MGTMKCPYCAEEIKEEAIKCKHCGAMLSEGARASVSGRRASPLLQVVGSLLFLGGLALVIYYWVYFDTSVSVPAVDLFGQSIGGGRVVNLSLMQERQTGLLVSGGAAALGLVLVIIGQGRPRSA